MRITPDQVDEYHRADFLMLPDLVPSRSCDDLRARAEHLLNEFDPHGLVPIFSTKEQSGLTDE